MPRNWRNPGRIVEVGLALSARLQVGDLALNAADLGDVGEINKVVQGRGGEQAALLYAPVALLEGLTAVGGNAPRSRR
jgi:hypothetical protein